MDEKLDFTKQNIINNAKESLGLSLHLQRKARGLSLKELSRQTGISIIKLDQAELGQGAILVTAVKLAMFYQTPINIKLTRKQ